MRLTVEQIKLLILDKIHDIKLVLLNEKHNHVFQLQYKSVLENMEELLEEIEEMERINGKGE